VSKVHKTPLLILACAIFLAATPALVRAQAATAAAEAAAGPVLAPVVAKVVSVVTPKKDPPGTTWLKAQVIHADAHSIVVQEVANPKMIHTFNYTPALQSVMQGVQNAGGFQYGARVNILYERQPGELVALRIKGKHS
jgi:hypothetical protein